MSNAKVIELHPKNPLCPCCPHPMGQHWSEEGVCQAKDCMCILADDYDWEAGQPRQLTYRVENGLVVKSVTDE